MFAILFYRGLRRADRTLLDQAEEIAVKAVETLIADGIEKAMAAIQRHRFREKARTERKLNAKLRNHVHRQSERNGRRD